MKIKENNVAVMCSLVFFIIGVLLVYMGITMGLVSDDSDALIVCMTLVIMGLIFMAVSSIGFLSKYKEIKNKKLKQTGICKRLPIFEINYGKTSKSVNAPGYHRKERTQYVVLQDKHEEEDTAFLYKSREVFADLFSAFKIGGMMSVYIDRENPSNYYVDLESYHEASEDIQG